MKFVVLRVSLPEAVRRAQVDPSRGASKDPAFLAELEKTIEWGDCPRIGWTSSLMG